MVPRYCRRAGEVLNLLTKWRRTEAGSATALPARFGEAGFAGQFLIVTVGQVFAPMRRPGATHPPRKSVPSRLNHAAQSATPWPVLAATSNI